MSKGKEFPQWPSGIAGFVDEDGIFRTQVFPPKSIGDDLRWITIAEHSHLLAEARREGRADGARFVVDKIEDMMSCRTTEEAWKLVHKLDAEAAEGASDELSG